MRQQRLRRTSGKNPPSREPSGSSNNIPFNIYSTGSWIENDHFQSVGEFNPRDEDKTLEDKSQNNQEHFRSRRSSLFVTLVLILSSIVAWKVIKSAVVWLVLACAGIAFVAACLLIIRWLWRLGWRKVALWFMLASLAATLFLGANVAAIIFDPKIDEALRTRMPAAQHTVFYTHQGNGQAMEVYGESERFVAPDEVWESWFSRSAIAIEDERYLTRHEGVVDLRAVLRAIRENLREGKIEEGASGIDIQTAKLMLGSFRTGTFFAKLGQWLIAMRLAQRFDDPSVRFCLYANIVVLTGERRGVGIAAADLFGKSDLRSLSIPESALLAGMLQNPTTFNPRVHPQAALARRNVVLDKMHDLGMINNEQLQRARQETVNVLPRTNPRELLVTAAIQLNGMNEGTVR